MKPDPRRIFPVDALLSWINERLHLDSAVRFFRNKTVPNHKHTFWYLFGGLTLFFFLVQLITGGLLLLYYQPTPESAHESVKRLIEEMTYGRFIRSLHIWSSHAMVVVISIHMFSVFFLKAYRKPREAMWITGFALFLLTLGFAFTGYLLPWDTTAFFATQVGIEIVRSMPIIGESLVLLLLGGSDVGANTLTRSFALHVYVLPMLTLALVAVHLLLNQIHGSSRPIGVVESGPPIPFYPDYVRRDWMAWLIGASFLVVAASGFPWGLGTKADPLQPAPADVRPEWYFLFLYETLRLLPARLWFVSAELVVNLAFAVIGLIWWLVPLLDKKASLEIYSLGFTTLGLVLLVYVVIMTFISLLR